MAELILVMTVISGGFAWRTWAFLGSWQALKGLALAVELVGLGVLVTAIASGGRRWAAASSWVWTIALIGALAWGELPVVQAAAWAGVLVFYWEVAELYALLRDSGVAPREAWRPMRPVRRALGLAALRALGYAAAGASLASLVGAVRVRLLWPLYLLAALALLAGLRGILSMVQGERYGDSHGEPAGKRCAGSFESGHRHQG
ncbi:MAG: hypothetical protein AB1609_08555 [Bacillota bacterium]